MLNGGKLNLRNALIILFALLCVAVVFTTAVGAGEHGSLMKDHTQSFNVSENGHCGTITPDYTHNANTITTGYATGTNLNGNNDALIS